MLCCAKHINIINNQTNKQTNLVVKKNLFIYLMAVTGEKMNRTQVSGACVIIIHGNYFPMTHHERFFSITHLELFLYDLTIVVIS